MKLKYWREENVVILQDDLAERTKFSKAYICDVENGKIKPSVKFRRNFINAFGKDVHDMIDEFTGVK